MRSRTASRRTKRTWTSTGSGRTGPAATAHETSRSAACGILPDQGTNPRPLHRQADSQPPRHQGSPKFQFLTDLIGGEYQVIHPKTDQQRCRLQEACKDILLFKNLDQEQLSQVLDAMFERTVKVDEHVIDQGDDGDNFYVIERGTYDILVTKDNQTRCVGQYDNHGSFGELALMYNTPRAATIVATSEGSLWGLDRVTFRRIIVKNNAKKRKMFESFIESVLLLKSLEVSERMKIVDVIGEKIYKDGERIITQGEKADSFYIIESGEVSILIKSKTKANKDGGNQEVEIARCHKGQYFGELALVTNKPRAASAYAVGDVKCLVMDVQAFERLLGPCMDIMKRNISHYEEQLVKMFGSSMDLIDPGQ
ncbi:cAMP-dependent protein kinase type II-alpha regulatory subunit isoform X2 [Orcinus orca]|uniref:cAMP-dependent protein kinase type II-alpha regulatory subunit isoform X2 n=1 Tax=Orcinus orca TaxID=9733 RepID=UPI00211309B9|nr:cAMP-dependent protein kinase type II-alpha regulatory subunit isoform X2 [Orcinus orca]